MTTDSRRHPNVVNVEETQINETSTGTRFGYRARGLASAAGGKGIGASWYEIPPGRSAYPRHYHCANEEAAFILEGEGTVRIGDATVPIRAGDWVSFPVGPGHAHQITNTGDQPLRYLALSTMLPVEVVGYPDSQKIGLRAWPPNETRTWLRAVFREGSTVEYFDGEKVD